MLLSIIQNIQTNRLVPPAFRPKWRLLSGMIAFFFAAYIVFLLIQSQRLPIIAELFPIELVSGCVFLGGAFFVYLITKLAKSSIHKITESETLLREAHDQLEERVQRRTRDLQETMNSLGQEIVARKKATKAMANAYGELVQILNSAADGIIVIDHNMIVLRVNRTFTEMMAVREDEIIGRPCCDLVRGTPCNTKECSVRRIMRGEKRIQREQEIKSRDGRVIPCLITAYPYVDSEGNLIGVVESFRDISDRKCMENRLKEMSVTDELTGLLNRRGFMDTAEKQLLLAQRLDKALFLLYIDVDGLKRINDTLGHAAGDMAIIEAAQVLKSTFRKTDLVGIGRLGGDEFAVLMFSAPGTPCDHPVIARLREQIAEINRQPGRSFSLDMSIGVVAYSFDAPCTIDELLVKGDEAMYACKNSKKTGGPALPA